MNIQEKIKIHEFDGTYEGFKLMIEHKFGKNPYGPNNFDLLTGIADLQNGCRMQKGDHYIEILKSEKFEVIG
jgi:hypothetical protein